MTFSAQSVIELNPILLSKVWPQNPALLPSAQGCPETLPPESGVSGKGESAEIVAKKIGKSKNDVKAIRAIRLLERGELPERPR